MWCGIQLKGIALLFVVHLSAFDVIFLLLARLGGFLVIWPLEDAPNAPRLSQLKHLGRRLIILILTDVIGNNAQTCNTEKMQLQSSTLAERKKVEVEHGVRYTVSLELPYFDAPRMCIIAQYFLGQLSM